MSWSDGQRLAIEQLEEIAAAAHGQFVVEGTTVPEDNSACAKVAISLTTGHLPRALGGLPLKARERLVFHIPQRFPFQPPKTYTAHRRFAGFPHVQWGHDLCLYQSPEIEYAPPDGMFGVVDRLNEWLRAGAIGQLDPDDAPLHAPAVYATADEQIVVRRNAPTLGPDSLWWVGAARLKKQNPRRLDLQDWVSLDDEFPILGDEEAFGAVIILARPLPFEYPDTVFKLVIELLKQGLSAELLMRLMRLYSISLPREEPLYFVVGAPMRRMEAGALLRSHLAVWRVEPSAADSLRASLNQEDAESMNAFYAWAGTASTSWCRVFEDRPEVTIRRDTGSPSEWLRGKRILLLGCGAIGSNLADYVVRAGAATLDLVDKDVVTPGILVRQNYVDADIGFPKAFRLKVRLDQIGAGTAIAAHIANLSHGVFSTFAREGYDLGIDATAANSVGRVLEQELATPVAMPLLSMSVSSRAEFGLACLRMPGFTGGPIDIERRVKLEAIRRGKAAEPFVHGFWPTRDTIKLFQPEPGCSEPTFIGSAADMAAHLSQLLTLSLKQLAELDTSEVGVSFISAGGFASPIGSQQFVLGPPTILDEARYGYRIALAETAKREIQRWIAQNKRLRGAEVETGGLMFGSIDESLKTVWLDRVSGPPPDSEASAAQFLCGVEGTRELAAYHERESRSALKFIGIWHTHPVSVPRPSAEDLGAMLQLLVLEHAKPRHVLMLIVGYAATTPRFAAHLFKRNEFRRRATSRRGRLPA